MYRLLAVSFLSSVSTLLCAADPSGVVRALRVYDVRFLTRPVPQLPAGEWPRAGDLVLHDGYEAQTSATISFTSEAVEVEDHSVPPGAGIPAETLVALIRQNIAEDSWANDRNSIEARSGEILVVQTAEVHASIDGFLAGLRGRRARMITVDVAYVPSTALGGAEERGGPSIGGDEMEAILGRAAEQGIRISLTAYNEQKVSGFSGKRTTRITDNEVNQTGAVPVTNPVVESLPLGLSVEVLPVAVSGSEWIRVDLRATRLVEAGEARKRGTFFGDLEFLTLDEQSIETTLLLTPGRAAIAGVFRQEPGEGGRAKRDFAIIARARPVDLVAAKATDARTPGTPSAGDGKEDGFELRMYDASFLIETFSGESAVLTPDILEKLIVANADPAAWRDERARISIAEGGGALSVTARASTHARVRDLLHGLVRERARVATVEVVELEGSMGDLLSVRRSAEGGTLLPAGWPDAEARTRLRERLRATISGILGCKMAARGHDSRGYVSDISTVSGGTGFVVTAMPDPGIRSAGSGFRLEAAARAVHDGKRFALTTTLDDCVTRFEKTASLLVPADLGPAEPAPPPRKSKDEEKKKDAGKEALPRPTTIWLPAELDLPSQRRLTCRSEVAIPAGRPAIIRIESGEDGKGRLVIATARVAEIEGGK